MMKKALHRRVLTVVSASVTAAALLSQAGLASAAGASASEPTLSIAEGVIGGKNPQENTAFANAIGQALHCKVQLINTSTGNYDQKMMAMLAAGQKIDVVYTEGSTLAELAKAGEVTNLQGMIQKSKVLGNPKVVPQWEWNNIKLSSPNGKGIYAVPVKYQGALMAIVREDWMKQLKLSLQRR